MNAEDLTCSICLGFVLTVLTTHFAHTIFSPRIHGESFTEISLRRFYMFDHVEDIFKPPIRMAEDCGHNFCHSCISEFIGRQDLDPQEFWDCPECRSVQEKHPRQLMRNRLVEKAMESFLDSDS